MNIQIKLVKECSKGEYGTCEVTSVNSILIEISKKRNVNNLEYFCTLLHELLHAWIFIMKANGIKIGLIKEHKWIYNVQAVIFEALKLINKNTRFKRKI